MQDPKITRIVETDQLEERSMADWYLQGAATTAGGLTVIGAKQVVGKIVDKVKAKAKD
jgi:hypothetical protein